jgi:hypothetical protein
VQEVPEFLLKLHNSDFIRCATHNKLLLINGLGMQRICER